MATTSADPMEPEVLKAMPRPAAIRRIVLYVAIALVAAFSSKVVFLPWLKDYLSITDEVEALFRFKIAWDWRFTTACRHLSIATRRTYHQVSTVPAPGHTSLA
jgi:hypothetical protein